MDRREEYRMLKASGRAGQCGKRGMAMAETEQNLDMQKRWEALGISNDFLFGKVMRDPELCKELLQRIFPDMKIDRVEFPTVQKTIRVDADAKSIRLDLYVVDDVGAVYDIEMQAADTKELPKRTRYYQSVMDLEMIDKGEPYTRLKKSFIIFICPFDLFGEGRHVYTFRNCCMEDRKLLLGDDTAKIFLNAKGTKKDVSKELREFLNYVDGKKSKDSFVVKLDEAVKRAKQNREWRHEYMTLLMRDQEKFEQGMERGREQGREQEKAETIIRMYKNGFTMEQIALCTNKGVDEVKVIIEREKSALV